MAQPHPPLEAQGLGCGLVISVVGMTAFLAWLGVPPGPAIIIAIVLAGLSILGYTINQFKAQRILDKTYKEVTEAKPMPPVETPAPIESDGNYRVVGVDRESGMDTTWYTTAASAANAKVKGELQGIVVTEVTRA
jgi:hypothetical protein